MKLQDIRINTLKFIAKQSILINESFAFFKLFLGF